MNWERTLGRLAPVMTPNAQLVIVDHGARHVPWQDELLAIIRRHSRNPDYDPRFSLIDALQERDLFELTGTADSSPLHFRQSIADYIEQFHSTATLAREHMSPEEVSLLI